MKEKLINRVGRIISGSIHSLVDSIENAAPETVLTEAVREVEAAIDEMRLELGQVAAKKHLVVTNLKEADKRHRDLGEKIELAVGENRDDLAEAAIARQLDIEAQIPVLERTIAECEDQETELEHYINALLAKRREMNREVTRLREASVSAAAPTGKEGAAAGRGLVESRVAKAESVFDRVMEARTGIPGQSGGSASAQLAELEELSRKTKIQERLSRIKGDAGSS